MRNMKKCTKKYLLDIPGHLDMESDDLFEVLTEYHNTSTATLYQNYGDSVETMNTKKEFSSKYNIHSLEDLAEYINLNFKEAGCYPTNSVKEIIGRCGYQLPDDNDDPRIVCKSGYKEIWLINGNHAQVIDNDLPF